jgi:hypothetical protein
MDNENPFYLQSRSIQFPFYDLPWIFKNFSSEELKTLGKMQLNFKESDFVMHTINK